jgi:hypothetical protein
VLEQIKFCIRDQLALPQSAALVLVGCIAHLALNALLRKSPTSAWGLLAPLVLTVALESYEIWIHYRNVGLFAPGNDPLVTILARHGLDVVKTLAAPLLLVVIGALFCVDGNHR